MALRCLLMVLSVIGLCGLVSRVQPSIVRRINVDTGDYTVSMPSTFVATNDLSGARNGLDSLFQLQNASGAMLYAGGMFTSHLDDA